MSVTSILACCFQTNETYHRALIYRRRTHIKVSRTQCHIYVIFFLVILLLNKAQTENVLHRVSKEMISSKYSRPTFKPIFTFCSSMFGEMLSSVINTSYQLFIVSIFCCTEPLCVTTRVSTVCPKQKNLELLFCAQNQKTMQVHKSVAELKHNIHSYFQFCHCRPNVCLRFLRMCCTVTVVSTLLCCIVLQRLKFLFPRLHRLRIQTPR